jgi:DNA polymerase-3 subunit gamma/tau
MLTKEASNALLKTLEEPPAHVKFIFATTQPNKVIATVSSRCQRFDFRRISASDIVATLKGIAKEESIKADEGTLFTIARQADGSLRDAESILDQLNTFCDGKIGEDDVARILGTVSEDLLERFAGMMIKRDAGEALSFIDRMINEGKDVAFFLLNLVEYFRNLMVAKVSDKPGELIELAPQTVERIRGQSQEFSQQELFYISGILMNAYDSARRSHSARVIFEMAVIKIIKRASLIPLREIMKKLEDLEKSIDGGTARNAPPVSRAREADHAPREPEVIPPPKAVQDRPKDAPGDNGLEGVEQIWPTLLQVIKSRKMSVASYLLEGNLVSFREGRLTISFPKNYTLHKEALETKDNKALIEKTLSDILHSDVRVDLVTDTAPKEEERRSSGGRERPSGAPVKQKILKEPAIQSALEVFDGRIVNNRNVFRGR